MIAASTAYDTAGEHLSNIAIDIVWKLTFGKKYKYGSKKKIEIMMTILVMMLAI